jgi:hypothetical protein
MSDEPYDYDPGSPYDPPPRRRRRRRRDDYRRPSEHDDAWAAADDMADEYDDVSPAGLAAGYDWEDSDRYGVDADYERQGDWVDDLDDAEPSVRRPPRRSRPPRGRSDRPPADLGPLPREAQEMRRRRDQFSPQDPPEIARHRDPRTGGRDYHPRDEAGPATRRRDMTRYGNPNYHRDRARRHEYAEYPAQRRSPTPYPAERAPQKPKRQPSPAPGALDGGVLAGIPTWQLMVIVGMAITAFLAVAFTCVMLLTLL